MDLKELYRIYQNHPDISTDSREEINNGIFFALKGENFNGNRYAEKALQKGAAYAIIDQKEYMKGDGCILVDDVLTTLQQLALFHRHQLKIPVIGITGSNGKTTTKELIAKVLAKKFKTEFTRGNLNNHIGAPVSILRIKQDTEIAVIEMGANHQGEISDLCQITEPHFGLITNIGKAHLEGFGDFEGVVKAKSELYKYILQNHGSVFVNNNNPLLNELSKSIPRITYGAMPDADCHGKIKNRDGFLKITWNSALGNKTIQTQLYGAYNFENIMAAICIGNYFGVQQDDIIKAIEDYQPHNQRSEIINTRRNVIYMDAYNANPSSMELAIREFLHMPGEKKSLVLGDMLELGSYAEEEHAVVLNILRDEENIRVYLVGPEFCKANRNRTFENFNNTEELIKHLEKEKPSGRKFLVKGSRGIKLEKVIPHL